MTSFAPRKRVQSGNEGSTLLANKFCTDVIAIGWSSWIREELLILCCVRATEPCSGSEWKRRYGKLRPQIGTDKSAYRDRSQLTACAFSRTNPCGLSQTRSTNAWSVLAH